MVGEESEAAAAAASAALAALAALAAPRGVGVFFGVIFLGVPFALGVDVGVVSPSSPGPGRVRILPMRWVMAFGVIPTRRDY